MNMHDARWRGTTDTPAPTPAPHPHSNPQARPAILSLSHFITLPHPSPPCGLWHPGNTGWPPPNTFT
eukprot:scaffold25416_cov84-Isochrysis_galbana.AAC.2